VQLKHAENKKMAEPKRITAFRLAIAKQIPKFPNDKTSLQALEAKSLGSLLIDYANWAIRYIAPRSRTVVVEQSASSDPRWQSLGAHIQALLKKAEDGDDLTPHLSPQTHRRGFTPAASVPGPNVNRWADKDMLLNVMGYHHLHLDAGPATRCDLMMCSSRMSHATCLRSLEFSTIPSSRRHNQTRR
jgi:hypothetical protein